jgi:glycosyltransferase involved in cell wall biosynthesis
VLHIGNIANNAYNNAKIQRRFGIAADVICVDYYHIMGCPEWEDADFIGTVANPTLPDWWAVDLRGFRRPRWFAQGPGRFCRWHLASAGLAAMLSWRVLTAVRWVFARQSRTARFLREAVLRPGWYLFRRARAFVGARRTSNDASPAPLAAFAADASATGFPTLCVRLVEAFQRYFPDRADCLGIDEIARYADFPIAWRPLLARYDMIQAYATDPAIPLVCGLRNFAAYEHGTIRDLPFQDTVEGRMCALSYREAPAVFVTNSDNLQGAARLGIAADRLFCLPHAFDDTKLRRFAADHPATLAASPCVFFSPARQHWTDRDPGFAKGNDMLLRALPLVRRAARNFTVVLVEWGRDVAASKALLAELGCGDLVRWIPVLKKRDLWAQYLASHAIVDQFVIPALGGVAFEAMALGRRTITALDEGQATRFFGAPPPLFACRTVDEVAAAMLRVLADPKDAAGQGEAAQRWIERYHSARRIVAIQLEAYRRILNGDAALAPSAGSFSRGI